MKFLCIYKPAKPEGAPPTPDDMEKMGAYIDKSIKSGVLIATEGCLPSALGAKVRRAEGKFTVTDGPFSEAKEVVGGFALIRANSKEHAIADHAGVYEYRRRWRGRGAADLRGVGCLRAARCRQVPKPLRRH